MTRTVLTTLAVAALLACGNDGAITGTSETAVAEPLEARVGPFAPQSGGAMALQLEGGDFATPRALDDYGDGLGALDALCFTVELIDVVQGRRVGTATDCLSEVTPVGDGFTLIGTTFFDFDNGGSFATRGRTSVQPVTDGSAAPRYASHVTGSVGDPAAMANAVIQGTGRFSRLEAMSRLSGAVNMDNLGAGEISFDCIFIITPI